MEEAVSVARLGLPGVETEVVEFRWPRPYASRVRTSRHVVSLSLTPIPAGSRGRIGAGQAFGPLGELLFVPAGEELSALCDGGDQTIVRCWFSEERFEQLTGFSGRWTREELTSSIRLDAPRLRAGLATLAEEIVQPGFASARCVDAMVQLIAIDVLRSLGAAARAAELEGGGPGPLRERQLRRIEERISDPAGPLPTVAELAAELGISSRHLLRGYRAAAGRTLSSRLREASQALAAELVVNSDLPLKAISHRLGFSSQSGFSTAFRNSFGVTPREFRRRRGR
jgi:AraC family transcriptional regulator